MTDAISTDEVTAVRYDRDSDGIVTLTLDDPGAGANTMNDLYRRSMRSAVDRLYDELAQDESGITGVVVTSAKRTFFAGGDLHRMMRATPDDAPAVFAEIEAIKADLRRLETLPRPVVAAINGAALGGGYEIALACQHRVVVDDPAAVVGLPEVTLGLLPGGGGVTRVTRMFGVRSALMDVLLRGRRFKPADARAQGLVDQVVGSDDLVPAAKAWILDHRDDPDAASNPWDRPGYRMPGGTPQSAELAALLPAFPALLRQQAKGAVYPAQRAILSAAVEGASVDLETASRIESRYLTRLVVGQNFKNMAQAFFFDLQAINAGRFRPPAYDAFTATRVAVLGAGMMGAGIAYSCARAGLQVVLKDVSLEAAERGKGHSERLLAKAVDRGRVTRETSEAVLARITPTADPADLTGCDLVIEAVFEDPDLKQRVFAEVMPYVDPGALLCSNTSTLPITELASGVDRPGDFVGLHFFSPVDKMPLVEIIRGEQTGDAALAKAYDVVRQISKTPIVVNDSRGFFTSRVIGTMVNEGLAMLAEGVPPMSLERAALQDGYPVGPLQLTDELNMELVAKIARATREAAERDGTAFEEHPGQAVVARMIELGRPSRLAGAGFYDYRDGVRTGLWPGLADEFPASAEQMPFEDVKDRLTFVEALETARCFEEGVIESSAAANIGSVMGIGFPAGSGGAAQFMTGYQSVDRRGNGVGPVGLAVFLDRADQLADRYGERFRPTAYLRDLAATGGRFPG